MVYGTVADALQRAGITPWAWVVNNSVAASQTRSPLLRQRAVNEMREIATVAQCHAQRHAVVPLLAVPPTGADGLHAVLPQPA